MENDLIEQKNQLPRKTEIKKAEINRLAVHSAFISFVAGL
jgi:hypothetical protein